MPTYDSWIWWADGDLFYHVPTSLLVLLPSHMTLVLVESKDSGLVFIGGGLPPLLTSLVVVGLAFTFDPSLVVNGSLLWVWGGFY